MIFVSLTRLRIRSIRFLPFHGGNTGSNPVGDANKSKDLAGITNFAAGPKRSNKEIYS
jgi:hypothetical protein